jgi:hypothetical protein
LIKSIGDQSTRQGYDYIKKDIPSGQYLFEIFSSILRTAKFLRLSPLKNARFAAGGIALSDGDPILAFWYFWSRSSGSGYNDIYVKLQERHSPASPPFWISIAVILLR